MTLAEAHASLDARVIYSTRPGEADPGVITEVRSCLVFVRFGVSVFAVACRPEDLTLMRGASVQEHFLLNHRDAGFPAADTWMTGGDRNA